MTYVVLKGYLIRGSIAAVATEPRRVYRKDSSFISFSFILVFSIRLVSDPGLVSPLMNCCPHFEEKGGSAGRGVYHERSKKVGLFQIYNMDSGNAM